MAEKVKAQDSSSESSKQSIEPFDGLLLIDRKKAALTKNESVCWLNVNLQVGELIGEREFGELRNINVGLFNPEGPVNLSKLIMYCWLASQKSKSTKDACLEFLDQALLQGWVRAKDLVVASKTYQKKGGRPPGASPETLRYVSLWETLPPETNDAAKISEVAIATYSVRGVRNLDSPRFKRHKDKVRRALGRQGLLKSRADKK